ncbi:hypothetical protein H6F32_13380 [Anabaena sp. FACHB-1237]|uniref:hypothetical protein n=1 Tax=Anabaena sp. FACHB-1237 TaxID=2692769 RepID=UPI00168031CB|nr:hypothetical protein [Anabaena sp. FACHB-1237]MBD2138557.1 hypothetical protein [Anabaena sp. FACHB-1237]
MRHFFLEILLPFILTSLPSHILAKEIPLGNSHQHTALAPDTDKFYTKSAYLPQLLDQLLSRKGKIGLVRELPLVSGEKKSNPILPIVTDIFLSQLDSNLKPVLESINNFFWLIKNYRLS